MASEGTTTIPQHILTDIILYRLPTKSLGRFKSVSNNWRSLISHPQFIKTHLNTYNHTHLICHSNVDHSLYSLLFIFNQHQETKPNKLLFQFLHTDHVFTFHGSCNGLVFGVLNSIYDPFNAPSLVIFNPTTREIVELPKSDHDLVNNWLEIDIVYGFGYDSVADDYKVVTISYFHYGYLVSAGDMNVHVYSLRGGRWRSVMDSPYDHSHGKSSPGVFVNGFLHWIAHKGPDRLPVIAAFSLTDEKFSELPSPDIGNDADIWSKSGCKLVVVGEKLAVFVEDIEVWLMNEYGVRESWSKIVISGLGGEVSMVEPKILYVDGRILLVSCDLMWVYDVEGKSLSDGIIDRSWNGKGLKVEGAYVESLVSPKLS